MHTPFLALVPYMVDASGNILLLEGRVFSERVVIFGVVADQAWIWARPSGLAAPRQHIKQAVAFIFCVSVVILRRQFGF